MLKTEPTSQGFYAKHNSEEGYTNYLRFYADGTVIGATHSGAVQDVTTWLVPGPPQQGTSVGNWQKAENNLSFVMTSESGSVEYTGTFSDDGSTLHLNSLSHINGHRGFSVFVYVPTPIDPSSRVPDLFLPILLVRKAVFRLLARSTAL